MGKDQLPRVLIVDVNAWREDAASDTLMEIFRCWNSEKLALVYTSSEMPDTSVCGSFFQIGESQVLESVFKPWKRVGRVVNDNASNKDRFVEKERGLRKLAHRQRSSWMRFAREIAWAFGHWKTKALDSFIRDFNPEILFFPVFPYAYMGRIQQHIMRIARCPIVCFLSDDNYSYEGCRGVSDYVLRFLNRRFVRLFATCCSEMFVIVDKGKEEIDRRFGTNSVILTKSIDFTDRAYSEKKAGEPLRFVYTGSLLIGRGETMGYVADFINDINREFGEIKVELYVYSQTHPSDTVISHFESGSAHFCGSVSHGRIESVLDDADVVIFAEALEGKESNIARLSFSTKITDYLSSGKCILAIGKEDIAPIEYFRRYNSAIIATSTGEIKQRIREIVENPSITSEYGRFAFECAKKNHEKIMMEGRFINTMLRAENKAIL